MYSPQPKSLLPKQDSNRRDLQQPPATCHQPRPTHVRLIPVEQIFPNPHQPRKHYDEVALLELADSIHQHGILQPILLRQRDKERFEIIAGERRYRAAKLAGLTVIPAIVRRFSDEEQAEVSLIENLQREDLSPVETARAFRTLMQQFGMTQTEIAKRVVKDQSTISHLLRLLQLPEEILRGLDQREIQEGHARALLRIEDAELRERLCQRVVAERLSVRETESLVRAAKGAGAEPGQQASVRGTSSRTNERALQEQLTQKFGRQIRIKRPGAGKGEIVIGFTDDADLLCIANVLLLSTSA